MDCDYQPHAYSPGHPYTHADKNLRSLENSYSNSHTNPSTQPHTHADNNIHLDLNEDGYAAGKFDFNMDIKPLSNAHRFSYAQCD
jgi:hypothetical protein